MGLLDAFGYSAQPQGDGLLDFLRRNALAQNAPVGMPSDTVQYDPQPQAAPVQAQAYAAPSPLDSAQWPAVQQPAPQYAQATQQLNQTADIGDRLGMAARGFVGNMHNGLVNALMGGVMPLATGQPTDPSTIMRNSASAGVAAMTAKGVPENIARAAYMPGNEKLRDKLIDATFASEKTNDAKNYEYGLEHPDFAASQSKEKGPKFGLTPIYATDDQGNPAAVQLNDQGGAQPVKLPNGMTLSKTPLRVDTADGTDLIDPVTRAVIAHIPKNIAAAASEKVQGTEQGKAVVALPQVQAASQQILKTIDDLQNHPGKGWSLGKYSVIPTIPGTQQADFRASLGQLQGQTFLQAYQTLRGGGAISDIEGEKGTNALARLQTAQSTQSFDKALNDFRGVIHGGMLRASAKARGPAGVMNAQPSPDASDPLGLFQ